MKNYGNLRKFFLAQSFMDRFDKNMNNANFLFNEV